MSTRPDQGTPKVPNGSQGASLSFERVLACERQFIGKRRSSAGFRDDSENADAESIATEVKNHKTEPPTIGLALSGGGIRSASISLGLIQGLRKHGLFRYVDYLSVISGGSYTGALVASSYYHTTGETTGHVNNGTELDIDLIGETVQPARVRALMNDGRYLVRPLEWANRFLAGWFSLLLVLGSGLLATSALVAFLWRSMDFYTVRDYMNELGMPSDMWSALLPLLVLFGLWIVLWAFSYGKYGASARGQWAKRVLLLMILCAIATVAGLIGNGDIQFSSGVQKTASYLKIPIIVSIFCGLIPTFFRKQLFKSGLAESSFLEKMIYRYTAVAVVLGIPMLLIGYFAREDVSRFNERRDGRLLWGDVKDFPAFGSWLEGIINKSSPKQKTRAHAEFGPKNVDVDVANLLDETRRLRVAKAELQTTIRGSNRWQTPPREPVAVLSIGGTRVADDTEIVTIGDEKLSDKPRRLTVLPRGLDSPVKPKDLPAYLPAVRDSESIGKWLEWKYAEVAHRAKLLLGHIFGGDADDPLGQAVLAQQRLVDRESKLLTVFNEFFLTDREFIKKYLPDLKLASIKWNDPPWDSPPWNMSGDTLKAQTFSLLNGKGAAAVTPDSVVEVNRIALEAAHPALVRSRSDIRRTVVIHPDQLHRFLMFLVFAAIFVISACVINPNTTSIQRYYQERLASAYLGGSDDAHNMRLTDLAPRLGEGPLLLVGGAANYRFRPANKDRHPDPDNKHPIESTERVGQFEFSPLFCGSKDLKYARTKDYCNGSLRLADAVAISGAALNPLYFERWEMLVIVGLLNLRLGQWMPNPSGGAISLKPTFAALMHDIFNLKERRITAVTDRRHVLLTDGGHYDNTGVQSLLERRCRVIIVCDGTQDSDYTFDSFANLIGRMKGQHGITFQEIGCAKELDLAGHAADFKNKAGHYFCCEIRYPAVKNRENDSKNTTPGEDLEAKTGLLIYFKSSLSGDEPPFVWHHAMKNSTFPHDSTVNQSFSPTQFCAYLGLGQHLIESALFGQNNATEEVGKSQKFKIVDFAALFLAQIDDAKRKLFLDKLLAHNRASWSEYEKTAEAFTEAVNCRRWQKLPDAMGNLSKCLTSLDRSHDRGVILDLLANSVIVLDDDLHPNAEKALRECAVLFCKVLVKACESDKKSNSTRQMAYEIRVRFLRPGQYRSVRPILRELGEFYSDDLLRHLLADGDVAHDGFIVEVMGELGERLLSPTAKRSTQLRKLLEEKRQSSVKEVRETAERMIALLE